MLSAICAKCHKWTIYAECHYAECAECHYAECAECHYAECAECHYSACRYDECSGATKTNNIKLL